MKIEGFSCIQLFFTGLRAAADEMCCHLTVPYHRPLHQLIDIFSHSKTCEKLVKPSLWQMEIGWFDLCINSVKMFLWQLRQKKTYGRLSGIAAKKHGIIITKRLWEDDGKFIWSDFKMIVDSCLFYMYCNIYMIMLW